ncbi:hypothetical protein [Gloeothece verrucosa]|uniref:hypothetical protein n=1 Tax=Gloeothece verrucosa TaxID=2546359 RepID=UPI0002D57ED1|nr:hypothetical protein [Gloeothece verrucosa]
MLERALKFRLVIFAIVFIILAYLNLKNQKYQEFEGKSSQELEEELDFYQVYGLILVEEKSKSQKYLSEAPYWLYGLKWINGTRDICWFQEEELISEKEIFCQDEF